MKIHKCQSLEMNPPLAEMGWTAKEAIGNESNVDSPIIAGKRSRQRLYFNSLHQKVGRLVIFNDPNEENILLIKLMPGKPNS